MVQTKFLGPMFYLTTVWSFPTWNLRVKCYVILDFFQCSQQAKYQIPRDPSLRSCYRASKLQRPKLKIHGSWCFGFNLQLAILEENTTHGSALVVELLAITIEKVMEHCRLTGQTAPDTLAIIGDNTVKELKNSICMGYVSNLINHGKLRLFAWHLGRFWMIFESFVD